MGGDAMFPYASPLRKSPQLRRKLALVLATAEDLIVQTNAEEAISFLESTERELPFEGALSIYFRMLGVPGRIRHAVTIRALSSLGEEPRIEELLDEVPREDTGGVRALARRLRGRQRESLRKEVDETTARARAKVRRSYLDGAVRTVESLRGVVPPTEAVQYFIDSLGIGGGWAELIFHEAMSIEWSEDEAADQSIPPGDEVGELGDLGDLG
jgi:hypothetical protein